MTKTYVGISVKNLNKTLDSKFTSKTSSDSKIMIGVPFQGIVPIGVIKEHLIAHEYIKEDDFIGNVVFLNNK